jgi:hypothetical protein
MGNLGNSVRGCSVGAVEGAYCRRGWKRRREGKSTHSMAAEEIIVPLLSRDPRTGFGDQNIDTTRAAFQRAQFASCLQIPSDSGP